MSDFESSYEEFGGDYEEGAGGSEGTKKKKKKSKGKKPGEKAGNKLTVAFIAIAAAFVVFVVLIMIESKLITEEETVPVVIAIAEVPEGLYLDEQNMPNYFAIEQRIVTEIPTGVTTYNNGTSMIGLITDRVIRVKEIVTSDCFYEENFYEGIEDPVEIAINLNGIGQTVGGILRAGDYVDIMAVIKVGKGDLMNLPNDSSLLEPGDTDGLLDVEITDGLGGVVTEQQTPVQSVEGQDGALIVGEDGMVEDEGISDEFELAYGVTGDYASQMVAENVRVVRVFTSGGETTESVEAGGGQMIATVINVVVPRSMADAILIAQQEGTITLTRVEDPFYVAPENVEEDVTGDTTEVAVDDQVTVVQ